ncbi:MAG: hypothetical protein JRI68_11690 [Deltaproteobacteria bacterium]|nr:hypothetical protein [Deltaproteobacteria bacterium]
MTVPEQEPSPADNPDPRQPPQRSAAQTEARLVVTARARQATRLDDWMVPALPPDPSVDELATLAARSDPDHSLWLAGGEPTLRADLPAVVAAVAEPRAGAVGMCTDGLALADAAALAPLRTAGLARVRLFLHCPQPEAHDWLVDQPGATKQVLRAARACAKAGLAVELQATITRPTMSHLVDLVELAVRLDIAVLHLRRLLSRGPAAAAYLMLAPRFALLERHLAKAMAAAAAAELPVVLHGHPPCTVPAVANHRLPSGSVAWLVPGSAAWQPIRDQLAEPVTHKPCAACPALPSCGGAPAAYVSQFGARELGGLDEHSAS